MKRTSHSFLLGVSVVTLLLTHPSPLSAQRPSPSSPLAASELALDSLLASPGPTWLTRTSKHFAVHLETGSRLTTAQLVDSLEAAWTHAVTLIGASVAEAPRIQVVVTASRTRFPRLMAPWVKGLATMMPDGGDVVLLVANDSVRAYTRHEVMHVVARRAWQRTTPARPWLIEGLATFADGQCQGTTLTAAARDILAAQPAVKAHEVVAQFTELLKADRGRAYVLAGSLVGYLWDSRGRAGVQRLWQGVDTLSAPAGFALLSDSLTHGWRTYVQRASGNAPGIDSAAFRRLACG